MAESLERLHSAAQKTSVAVTNFCTGLFQGEKRKSSLFLVLLGICTLLAVLLISRSHRNVGSLFVGDASDTILVSYPTVVSRERLLNQSISEETALKAEMQEADDYVGAVGTRSSSVSDRQANLSIGGKSSPPNSTAQTDKSNEGQGEKPDLFNTLDDRDALRARINETLAANDIYDAPGEIGGRGLFRFQFAVSLLPQSEAPVSAHIEFVFHAPKATGGTLLSMYELLLAQESIRSTKLADETATASNDAPAPASSEGKSNPLSADDADFSEFEAGRAAGRAAAAQLQEFLIDRGLFTRYKLALGQSATDDDACTQQTLTQHFAVGGSAAAANATKNNCQSFLLDLPYEGTATIAAYDAMFLGVFSPLQQAYLWGTGIVSLMGKPEGEALLRKRFDLHRPVDPLCHDFSAQESPDLESDDAAFLSQLAKATPGAPMPSVGLKKTFEFTGQILRYQPQLNAVFQRMASDADLSDEQRSAIGRLIDRLRQTATRAKDFVDQVVALQSAISSTCYNSVPVEFLPSVPRAFERAVAQQSAREVRLRGDVRPLRLEPSNRLLFEERNSSFNSEISGTGEFPVANTAVSIGGVQKKALVRGGVVDRATIISFSESSGDDTSTGLDETQRHGWILLPAVSSSDASHEWVQGQRRELLAIDVALPAWWPAVSIRAKVYWTRENTEEKVGKPKAISFDVPLPGAAQDADSLFKFLTSDSTIETRLATASLFYPAKGTTRCPGDPVSVIIRGTNLWHSPHVFLGAQESNEVSILPDMSGLTARFTSSQIAPDATELPLFVATSTSFEPVGKLSLSAAKNCSPSATK